MRLRQSTIKLWCSCPLQAKFRSIDQLPGKQNGKASFGAVIHYALELYNQDGNLDRAIDVFKHFWEYPEELGVAVDVWPKFTTYQGLRQRGIQILEEYHQKEKWESREVIATEHRFLVPFGDHELEGTVDLLEFKKNHKGKPQLRVVDYKTNGKQPSMLELRMNIQFTTYVYATMQPEFWLGNGPDFPAMPNGAALWDRFRDAGRTAIWYGLWQMKAFDAGTRDDEDFMRLYRVVDMIEKSVKAGVFVPNISGESCTYCPYTKECGLTIPKEDDTW